MSAKNDDENALGKLGRQEILTVLMIAVFGGFVLIVAITMYFVFSDPTILSKLTITGSIDLGAFVGRFDELLMAFIALLGVGIGMKFKSK